MKFLGIEVTLQCSLRKLAKCCSLDVVKAADYGLVYRHLNYAVTLWGSCSKHKFERVFKPQKKAVRIISKLISE